MHKEHVVADLSHETKQWLKHHFCPSQPNSASWTLQFGDVTLTFHGDFTMNQTLNPGFQVVATVSFVVPSTSPPAWATDSASVTVVPAADGLTAVVTYVSAGTANITATATDGTVATGQVTTTPGTVTNSGTITFGTPTPVGGGGTTTLAPSYPDVNTFAAAVAAYTGGQQVTLDGAEVAAGFGPPLAYVSNPDGTITQSTSFFRHK